MEINTLSSFVLMFLIVVAFAQALIALAGLVVLSTISKEHLPRKYSLAVLCLIIPCFGVLFFVNKGKWVPSLGSIEYESALALSREEYISKSLEFSSGFRKNMKSDSGYAGGSGQIDSADGGAGE